MSIRSGVSSLALVIGMGAAFPGIVARAEAAPANTSEARIEALEAELRALATEVRHLRHDQALAAAHPRTTRGGPVEAAAPPPPAPPVAIAANTPPAASPDTPRPVTNAGATAIIPGASIVGGKPTIASADGRFVANLHGVLQFDAADYLQHAPGPIATDLRRSATGDAAHARHLQSGTDLRRARIGIDGKIYGDFEYSVLLDFGGAGAEDAGHVQELWAQYSGIKPLHLRIGAFQPSIGLEDQASSNGLPFLERPSEVDVTRGLSASDFREGAELWAATKTYFLSGAITTRPVSTFNANSSSASQAYEQALGFVGRAAIIPLQGKDWLTHIGAHGSYAASIADSGGPDSLSTSRYPVEFRITPELRVDGTRLVDTGPISAKHAYTEGAEFAVQKKNFYLEGEYDRFGIDRYQSSLSNPDFSGWYVEGSWILTGERRKYNYNTFAFDAPPVDHPFDWRHGSWGAWELALRYSDLNLNYHEGAAGQAIPLDGVRGGDQHIFTAGVNWYLNPIVRVMFDYQHVNIDRLSPSNITFLTPVGAQIGQSYNAVAVRTQLAF